MVERGGKAKVRHVPNTGKRVIIPELEKYCTSAVYGDEARIYDKLAVWEGTHKTVIHSKNSTL